MGNQQRFSSRLRKYVSALGVIGQLLTLLGLLPALVDIIAPLFGLNIEIPSWASAIWFVFAFGLANLRIFEAQSKKGLEIQIKEYHSNITKWLTYHGNVLTVNPEFSVTLHAKLNIYNHEQRATHVKLGVISVESNWVPAKELTEFEVSVERILGRGRVKSGNPFVLEPSEINDNVSIRVEVIFRAPDRENAFRYLGSLSNLVIIIGAEQAGQDTIPLAFECDVDAIHQMMENEFVTRLQHIKPDTDMPRIFIKALKQFWQLE